jgi:mannose-6-phosphate isomerase-like protein (cupin superfamily)
MINKLIKSFKVDNPLITEHGEIIHGIIGRYGKSYSEIHSMDLCVFPEKNICNSLHYHIDMEESYSILSGKGLMKLGDIEFEVFAGNIIHVPPKTAHKIVNISDEPLEVLCACAPAWNEEQTVRLEIWDKTNNKFIKNNKK